MWCGVWLAHAHDTVINTDEPYSAKAVSAYKQTIKKALTYGVCKPYPMHVIPPTLYPSKVIIR